MEVVETDLGAFIVQLTGEDPYHIIAPALHLTLEQVRELFSREAGEELPGEPDVLAAYARRRLREKFLTAELGISGGNFGIASTGTVVLVTNEGNGRMSTTLPRTHVAVMGMERLLPDWESLDTALPCSPAPAPPSASRPTSARSPARGATATGTGRTSCTWCCWTTAARGSSARSTSRCSSACAAGPVSTTARCTGASAATPTTPSIGAHRRRADAAALRPR